MSDHLSPDLYLRIQRAILLPTFIISKITFESGVQQASYVKRPILDELAQWLEHVLMALEEVDDTRCRPNSSVPGVLGTSHFV